MSHWRHTMVDGTKFWISYQQLPFLSSFGRWQLIQNLAPSTIVWHQCDIRMDMQDGPLGLNSRSKNISIKSYKWEYAPWERILSHFVSRLGRSAILDADYKKCHCSSKLSLRQVVVHFIYKRIELKRIIYICYHAAIKVLTLFFDSKPKRLANASIFIKIGIKIKVHSNSWKNLWPFKQYYLDQKCNFT